MYWFEDNMEYGSFIIGKEEREKIFKWGNDHDCSIKKQGAIGGKLTYSFTPTNLGTVFKVSCACGKEIDLTDYEEW